MFGGAYIVTDEQKKLVENNTGLIMAVLKKIIIKNKNKDIDDFISIGYEALCTAAINYDSNKGSFSSLAYSCILHKIYRELKHKYRRENNIVSLEQKIANIENGMTYEDLLSQREELFEDKYIDHRTAEELVPIINAKLKYKDRMTLVYLLQYDSQEIVAEIMGVSRQCINQRIKNIKKILLKYYENGLKK